MKKIMIVVCIMSAALFIPAETTCGVGLKRHVLRNNPSVQKFFSSYLASLAMSSGIGATTGGLVRYFEKKIDMEASPVTLFLVLLSWAIESEIRNDIIAGIQDDLDEYNIEYKKGLMFKAAWIASWLTYLHM